MKGLFELRTPRDFYGKLQRDFEALRANPADTDRAFNFFVTAWHLLEWRFPGKANDAHRRTIADANVILRVCEHLAVGVKHFVPESKHLGAVKTTGRSSFWAEGFWAPGFWTRGFWAESLIVELDGPAARAFGPRRPVMQLAELAMQYWRAEEPSL